MLVLHKLPQLHDLGDKDQQSSQPGNIWSLVEIATQKYTVYSRWVGIIGAQGMGHFCIYMHACYCYRLSRYCALGLPELKLAAQEGWGWQPPPFHCQHCWLLNTFSEPHGQSPVQHLQLAAILAFAPEVSANSGSAAVLTAQEMPIPLLGPSPTTKGKTTGSIKSNCLVHNHG